MQRRSMHRATRFLWSATSTVICAVALTVLAQSAHAQTATPSVDVKGDCNATISGGSSNVVNVYCGTEKAPQSSEDTSKNTLIVHANGPTILLYQPDGFGGFMPFQFYPNVVNFTASSFRLDIGDEVFSNNFDNQFSFGRIETDDDMKPFEMKLRFQYFNGMTTEANCAGFLNIDSDAVISPRINVVVDTMTGQTFAPNCWFDVSSATG